MIDPASVALFVPRGLADFKLGLFERIGGRITQAGGRVVRHEIDALDDLPDDVIPIVGCTPDLRPLIDWWIRWNRPWIYWDRGSFRRVFATWLPRGANGGFYRWHVCSFQTQRLRDVPDDRWRRLLPGNQQDPRPMLVDPWHVNPNGHVVVAQPTPTYERFHKIEGWTDKTLRALARITSRQIVVRDKESRRDLRDDLRGAHCLIAHGSNAAVEAVVMGCPVFVDPSSSAALVGRTDINMIDKPVFPDRQQWFNTLAYDQYAESELVDGTLWSMLR